MVKRWWYRGGWRFVVYPIMFLTLVALWWGISNSVTTNAEIRQECIDAGGAVFNGVCVQLVELP